MSFNPDLANQVSDINFSQKKKTHLGIMLNNNTVNLTETNKHLSKISD